MKQCEASGTTLDDMPEHQVDAMMRTLIGCVSRLFENPDIKADYERWKRNKAEKEGRIS